MKKILLLLALTACVKTYPEIETTTQNAHNAVHQAVAVKPQCADVGKVCDEQITNVANSCKSQIAEEYKRGWNRGLLWGAGLAFVITLAIVGFALFLFNKIMKRLAE